MVDSKLMKCLLIASSICTTLGCTAVTTSSKDLNSQPSNVGIRDALEQIGEGFAVMGAANSKKTLGLYACQVKVNLNVTASANESDKLVVDLSATPNIDILDLGAEVDAESSATAQASRSNAIEVNLFNPACLPPGTLAYDKPNEYPKIIENLVGEAALDIKPEK